MTMRNRSLPTSITTIAEQLENLASLYGDELAIVEVLSDGSERICTRKELFEGVEKIAAKLQERGVSEGDNVIVTLPNCTEHVLVTIAAWQLGACCVFIAPSGTEEEKAELLSLLEWNVLVSGLPADKMPSDQGVSLNEVRGWVEGDLEENPLPFRACAPARAVATGGSSGTPKIVVQNVKPAYSVEDLKGWSSITGQLAWQRQLVPGGLFYNLYSSAVYLGLFFGQTIYLMEKFDATRVLELIEKHAIECMGLVPTMMERIMLEPAFETCDLSSLTSIFHSGAPCRTHAKLAWIKRLGAEKVFEFYSATEMVSTAAIRGDDWLEHRGSVGRAFGCSFQIRDEAGCVVPFGTIGEIFSKPAWQCKSFYLGVEPMKKDDQGFYSVGDVGWLDEEGYLYISDRRSDMIVTGGKNVYAAEVENVLCTYRGVKDAVVIGVPDRDWGRKVHAVIQLSDGADNFSLEALNDYLHQKISGYKCPKSFEIVDEIPRNEVGKIRRTLLVEQRIVQNMAP